MFFASNLHMEMGKTIGQSIRSQDLGIFQFWELFCQPFGKNTFTKSATKTTNGNFQKLLSFLSNQLNYLRLGNIGGWGVRLTGKPFRLCMRTVWLPGGIQYQKRGHIFPYAFCPCRIYPFPFRGRMFSLVPL